MIQALGMLEQDIKSMLNYTRGSILTKDIKDYGRKHETKLQVSQVGLGKKTSAGTTDGKASGNYFLNDEESDVEDEEIHGDLQDNESR